jgi:hypothetical protein
MIHTAHPAVGLVAILPNALAMPLAELPRASRAFVRISPAVVGRSFFATKVTPPRGALPFEPSTFVFNSGAFRRLGTFDTDPLHRLVSDADPVVARSALDRGPRFTNVADQSVSLSQRVPKAKAPMDSSFPKTDESYSLRVTGGRSTPASSFSASACARLAVRYVLVTAYERVDPTGIGRKDSTLLIPATPTRCKLAMRLRAGSDSARS